MYPKRRYGRLDIIDSRNMMLFLLQFISNFVETCMIILLQIIIDIIIAVNSFKLLSGQQDIDILCRSTVAHA